MPRPDMIMYTEVLLPDSSEYKNVKHMIDATAKGLSI